MVFVFEEKVSIVIVNITPVHGLEITGYLQGPLLQIWFNFNPRRYKLLQAWYSVRWNYLSIPERQRLHRWSWGITK